MNIVTNPLVYHIIDIKQRYHLLLSERPITGLWLVLYLSKLSLTPILPHFVVVCL